MSITRCGLALLLILVLAGCSKGSSNGGPDGGPIPTRDLYLSVGVDASNTSSVQITARLFEGNDFSNEILLTGGDSLMACGSSGCAPIARDIYDLTYMASLPYESDTDYVISFLRPHAVDAPETIIRVPPPFQLLEPQTTPVVSYGDSIDIAWTLPPPGAQPVILASNFCFDSANPPFPPKPLYNVESYPDPDLDGLATYLIDDLLHFPMPPFDTCFTSVQVWHTYYGRPDPNLFGASAIGEFKQSFQVDFEP